MSLKGGVKPPRATPEEGAPVLRAIYAFVFLGLAAGVIGAALPELEHLAYALTRPYHFGEPPRPALLLALALCGVAVVGILAAFLRRRPIPLPFSGMVLAAVVLAVWAYRQQPPQGRSWAAADKEILLAASGLQRQMVDTVQSTTRAPKDEEAWQRALAAAAKDPSPARSRTFARTPWRAVKIAAKEQRPAPLVPGMMLVWVSDDQVAFEIRPVGFDKEGRVAPLVDDRDEALVLTGTFNPDMRQPAQAPTLPPLSPLPGR